MKNFSFTRKAVLLALLCSAISLVSRSTLGANKQIILPPDVHGVIGYEVKFLHNGAIGVLAVGPLGAPIRLLSFTVSNAASLATELVLEELPGSLPSSNSPVGVVVNDRPGLVVVFGPAGNETVTAVGIAVDNDGNLTKKWAISHANPFGGAAEAAINADGSAVYLFYNDSIPKVDKIRAEDGALLGTIQLDDVDIEAGLTFDAALKRLIVKTGFYFHVLKPEDDEFAVDWRITSPPELADVRRSLVSADGRFLIAYAAYGESERANDFMTLDLESREIRILAIKSKMVPSGIAITFSPTIGAIIVPYSGTIKVKKGGSTGCACGTQVADWLFLEQDGTLTRSFTTHLTGDQIIGPLNNAAFSKTSAIAFLSTMNRHVIGIDTLTGEVVSDQEVGDIFFIQRIGDTDNFLITNGTNLLTFLDLKGGPSIDNVRKKKHKLRIEGENFLFGVRVEVNGQDAGDVTRSPDRPSREITLKLGKKDFPEGQDVEIVVINRDGLRSDPVTVRL